MAATYLNALIEFDEMYAFYDLVEFSDKINRKERNLKDRENLLESYEEANFKEILLLHVYIFKFIITLKNLIIN